VTVLLPTSYGHITVDHIFCPMRPNQAKLIGSSWVAQVLELVYMLVCAVLLFNLPFACGLHSA